MTLKPHHTLSTSHPKLDDVIILNKNLVWCIKFLLGFVVHVVHVGETGHSVGTRKQEYVDAVKVFNSKKSAVSQHVMNFDHGIDWNDVKILKSESHAY